MAVAVALQSLAAPLALAERSPPPAEHCMDARRMQEVHQSTPRVLGVALDDGSSFRIELAQNCPDMVHGAERAEVLARDGWACGLGQDLITDGDGRSCPIAAVAPIDARAFAAIARQAGQGGDVATMAPVEVVGERRRGFLGSSRYCLAPRLMRSWSEDGEGLLVEVNPRRSGGNRYYRVELAGSCPQLAQAESITLRSGAGNGIVCGYPGDHVTITDGVVVQEFVGRMSSIAIDARCEIAAVYPKGG